jgi:hypothetical protein
MDAYTCDIKSAYPKEMLPRWWQFKAKARIRANLRKETDKKVEDARQVAFVQAIAEALRHTQIATNATLHHTYAERPPAARPSRLTVVYVLQNGQEIREYVNLNSQHYTVTAPMHYVWAQEIPPSQIRYEFGYTDGSRW